MQVEIGTKMKNLTVYVFKRRKRRVFGLAKLQAPPLSASTNAVGAPNPFIHRYI
ncbi:hypothetical protein TSMEX_007127 [Taenia solium]|eukprot:TsM_000957200 transcript=TsM_000957200 gene=TsM_000957200